MINDYGCIDLNIYYIYYIYIMIYNNNNHFALTTM